MTEPDRYQEFVDLAHILFGENEHEGPIAIGNGFCQLVASAPSVRHGVAVYKAVIADVGRSGIRSSNELADELRFEGLALATGNRARVIHEAFAYSDLSINQAIEQRKNRETRYLPTFIA